MIGTTARWLVPRLMTLMTERHPKVHVVIVDATTSSLIPQLESGALDLAVVNMPIGDPDITADPLFDEDEIGPVRKDFVKDLPGGVGRYKAYGKGVYATVVNGQPIVLNGELTGRLPGVIVTPG